MLENVDETSLKQECENLKSKLSECRQELKSFKNALDNIWQTPAKKTLQSAYDDIDKIYEKLDNKLSLIDDICLNIENYKIATTNANTFIKQVNNNNPGILNSNIKLAAEWAQKANEFKQKFIEACSKMW